MLSGMHPTHPHAGANTLQSHEGSLLQRIFAPLNIAAYVTWFAISSVVIEFAKLRAGDLREWAGVTALVAMLLLFVIAASRRAPSSANAPLLKVLAQGVLVVVAEWLLRGGQTVILLIIVAGQVVLLMSPRRVVLYMVVLNAAIAASWISPDDSVGSIVLSLLPVLGFQAFAALTGHYAGSSEKARSHLAEVNAELLATRRLLEESARAGERLKLSRELHDVAGHSLTALKLNLARLARDPMFNDREELSISAMLADDLLQQIRQVVGTLRAHDGLNLRTALEALIRPIPGVRISIDLDDSLRVDDIEQAETLLRCAQEAVTNALRHGRATEIAIDLHRDASGIALSIGNNGSAPDGIAFGNGLTGMRERLDALGGTLDIRPTPPRGLRVIARIPLKPVVGFTA
jgi:signal transduction histidine kinase